MVQSRGTREAKAWISGFPPKVDPILASALGEAPDDILGPTCRERQLGRHLLLSPALFHSSFVPRSSSSRVSLILRSLHPTLHATFFPSCFQACLEFVSAVLFPIWFLWRLHRNCSLGLLKVWVPNSSPTTISGFSSTWGSHPLHFEDSQI